MSRKANEIVKGEELNVVIGSRPFKDDEVSEKIKLNLLNILFEKYGIVERDFLSAELELVPAFSVDDIGFDRSLIGGYSMMTVFAHTLHFRQFLILTKYRSIPL